jgi:hypothetical protein
MVIGTMFTLFVVPSIYMLIARRHVAAESEAAEEVAPAAAGAGKVAMARTFESA